MTATTASAYRVRGTTDDVTTCQQCGKPELKGTVILDILDEDGNTEDVIYAGTTCAAKMAGGRVAGAKIRQQATAADYRRGEIVRTAQEILAYYAPFEAASPLALGDAYAKANPGYFRNNPGADPVAVAQEAMSRRREVVATDGLSALRAA